MRHWRSTMSELRCMNCDGAMTAPDLFCCELCGETAKTVRYVRAVRADGRGQRPDVQEAVTIKTASVLGGGYPARGRRLSAALRRSVLERDGGHCRICGAEANQIDHIGGPIQGDINHPDNLQVLCESCHRRKTMDSHRPLETPEEFARAEALRERIEAEDPLRECDAADWADRWRSILKRRRESIP